MEDETRYIEFIHAGAHEALRGTHKHLSVARGPLTAAWENCGGGATVPGPVGRSSPRRLGLNGVGSRKTPNVLEGALP